MGVQYDVVEKSGAWFSYNGNKVAQAGKKAPVSQNDNPEVEKEIEGKIRDAAKGNKNGEETPAEEGASETKE